MREDEESFENERNDTGSTAEKENQRMWIKIIFKNENDKSCH